MFTVTFSNCIEKVFYIVGDVVFSASGTFTQVKLHDRKNQIFIVVSCFWCCNYFVFIVIYWKSFLKFLFFKNKKKKGNKIDLGDFDIYVGTIGRGAQVTGVIVQIIYKPCSSIELCEGLNFFFFHIIL